MCGSPVHQSLFYINHVPVYNVSHLFGFFSAFNSDDVNDIIRCASNAGYTQFYISLKKPAIVSRTLKDYEDLLSP